MLKRAWSRLWHVLSMSLQVKKMFCTPMDTTDCMKRMLLAKAPGMVSFQCRGFLGRLPCCQIWKILMPGTLAFLHGQRTRGQPAFQTDKRPLKAKQAADATMSTHLPWNLDELVVYRIKQILQRPKQCFSLLQACPSMLRACSAPNCFLNCFKCTKIQGFKILAKKNCHKTAIIGNHL